MKKLLLILSLPFICTVINGMDNDPTFKNVTFTRGSGRPKNGPSKKDTAHVTTKRGHNSSFREQTPLQKAQEGSPIHQAIAFGDAINKKDASKAFALARKMPYYGPAYLLRQATFKPEEKVCRFIGEYNLPEHIDRGKFEQIAIRGSKQRTKRLLG